VKVAWPSSLWPWKTYTIGEHGHLFAVQRLDADGAQVAPHLFFGPDLFEAVHLQRLALGIFALGDDAPFDPQVQATAGPLSH